MKIKIDKEFQGYCRSLTSQEYSLLEKNIIIDGCREPIVVWKGVILDGHHRYKICQEHRIEFKTVKPREIETRTDALMWMWKNQVGKRNIGWFEKAELGIKAFKDEFYVGSGRRRQVGTGGWSEKVGEIVGMNFATIHLVDKALAQLPKEDLMKLKKGEMTKVTLEAKIGRKQITELTKRRNNFMGIAQQSIQKVREIEKQIREEENRKIKYRSSEREELAQDYNIPWEETEHATRRKKRVTVDISHDGMTVAVLPDIHAQVTSRNEGTVSSAAKAALNFLDEFKPDVTIVLGDLLDVNQLSSYSKKKPRQIEGLRLDNDYALGNQILNRIDKATKGERVLLEGNHEERVERYLDEFPYVGERLLSVKENLHLDKRGWKFLKEGELLKIGHAYFIHGWYYNIYHARKHVAEMGNNIFYGHTHDVQSFSKPNPDTMPIISQSLGCLCDLNPSWLRNKPSRWVNAFGVFYFLKNGDFTHYVPIIVNGGFWWNGKYYTSKKETK